MANEEKTLSLAGLNFIKHAEEEGGLPKLKAYNDGTGTWTIAWGCTRGVHKGMEIDEQQAMDMLDAELKIHIAEVHKNITAPVSQGLFDALVSFFFNNGPGKCPSLIAAVNSGDNDRIRKTFMLYVKAYDEKLGRKVDWPGLVNRRCAELAHWAKMDHMDPAVKTPEAFRAPAPIEPQKPGWIVTAAQSPSFRMKLSSLFGSPFLLFKDLRDWVVDNVSWLFGVLPSSPDEIQSLVSTGSQVAGYFKTTTEFVLIPTLLAVIAITMVRGVNTKREAS